MAPAPAMVNLKIDATMDCEKSAPMADIGIWWANDFIDY